MNAYACKLHEFLTTLKAKDAVMLPRNTLYSRPRYCIGWHRVGLGKKMNVEVEYRVLDNGATAIESILLYTDQQDSKVNLPLDGIQRSFTLLVDKVHMLNNCDPDPLEKFAALIP